MAMLWASNEGLLREMVARGDGSPESRSQLADDIARLAGDYVQRQLLNRREHLMAEQAFRQEALLSPRLALLVRSHQQILLQGSCQLFQVLGSREPQQDAKVLTAIIGRMEYQGLLNDVDPQAEDEMLGILTRYMHLVLASV
jgi:DNA-binding transcriptional regulator YbjK